MIGIPGLIGDDFFKEYQRRDSITQNHSRPLDKNNIKNWFNTTREIPQGKFEEIQKQQMNEVIKTSRRGATKSRKRPTMTLQTFFNAVIQRITTVRKQSHRVVL